jgi:hypothetical protein
MAHTWKLDLTSLMVRAFRLVLNAAPAHNALLVLTCILVHSSHMGLIPTRGSQILDGSRQISGSLNRSGPHSLQWLTAPRRFSPCLWLAQIFWFPPSDWLAMPAWTSRCLWLATAEWVSRHVWLARTSWPSRPVLARIWEMVPTAFLARTYGLVLTDVLARTLADGSHCVDGSTNSHGSMNV